jgi:hypothetical protein
VKFLFRKKRPSPREERLKLPRVITRIIMRGLSSRPA